MPYRILLVEDEESLLNAIRLNLEMDGYQVTAVKDGVDALRLFKSAHFDLVILDVMLPGMDGFSVCRSIRMENSHVPVLFLTARDAGQDKVQGLKTGADDYLTKPFNLEEFLLRVQNLIKRSSGKSFSLGDIFLFGGNEVNFSSFEVKTFRRQKQLLSKKEINLLKLLIERKNEVVSREEILRTVWGYDVYPTTRTVDNFIVNFRKWFERNPRQPKHFLSVRGVGYRFRGD
jgi:two-component system alkaline phosphatase synthesis response regulator PhoP